MPDVARTTGKKAQSAKLNPEESFGYQVRRCHRRFDRLLNARLSKHNLKTGFWYYLRVLWIRDNVTQKYLSEATNVAHNTTAALISGMIEAGLAVRERDPDDKRKLLVRLTKLGRRLEQGLLPYAIDINRVATAGIAQNELDICRRVLARMSDNLEREFRSTVGGQEQADTEVT